MGEGADNAVPDLQYDHLRPHHLEEEDGPGEGGEDKRHPGRLGVREDLHKFLPPESQRGRRHTVGEGYPVEGGGHNTGKEDRRREGDSAIGQLVEEQKDTGTRILDLVDKLTLRAFHFNG